MPTFNEVENLSAITSELFSQPIDGLEVLVVDDDSPDGTGDLADKLIRRYVRRFHVIHRMGKAGLGMAYTAGFSWALNHRAGFVVRMDADFSHSSSYIPKFWH
jgi:dolichol-phosphate mannosyltransferase